jgi:2Fe-2S ferredoxin
MMDVLIKIKDRDGVVHELQAPQIWQWISWSFVRYEPVEGTCGGTMCASCQCYVLNDVPLPEMGKMKKRCSQKHFMSNQTVD